MIDIWIEKYRPSKLSEIVGQDANIRKIKSFVDHKQLPHLIFAGPAGTGKTTTAIAIAMELFGEDWRQNFLELNASNERGIDVIRENVKDFARIRPSNPLGFKIIFLDEAGQAGLGQGTFTSSCIQARGMPDITIQAERRKQQWAGT